MNSAVVNVVAMITYKEPIQLMQQTAPELPQQNIRYLRLWLYHKLVKISTTSVSQRVQVLLVLMEHLQVKFSVSGVKQIATHNFLSFVGRPIRVGL